MRRRSIFLIPMLALALLASCGPEAPQEKENAPDVSRAQNSVMVEKQIQISYADVYLDGARFTGGNRGNGEGIIPFLYGDTVFLPVHSFAEDQNAREAVWNEEKKTVEIGEARSHESVNESYRYPDVFPTEITVSYGGIALLMDGEEIAISEEEQLLMYEGVVYAPAQLLGRAFNKLTEWRQEEIQASYGTFDYHYLFMGPPLSSKIEFYADRKYGGLEANIQPQRFEPEPPPYLDITLK